MTWQDTVISAALRPARRETQVVDDQEVGALYLRAVLAQLPEFAHLVDVLDQL